MTTKVESPKIRENCVECATSLTEKNIKGKFSICTFEAMCLHHDYYLKCYHFIFNLKLLFFLLILLTIVNS